MNKEVLHTAMEHLFCVMLKRALRRALLVDCCLALLLDSCDFSFLQTQSSGCNTFLRARS